MRGSLTCRVESRSIRDRWLEGRMQRVEVPDIVRRRYLKLGRSEAENLAVTAIGGLLPWWKNQKGNFVTACVEVGL